MYQGVAPFQGSGGVQSGQAQGQPLQTMLGAVQPQGRQGQQPVPSAFGFAPGPVQPRAPGGVEARNKFIQGAAALFQAVWSAVAHQGGQARAQVGFPLAQKALQSRGQASDRVGQPLGLTVQARCGREQGQGAFQTVQSAQAVPQTTRGGLEEGRFGIVHPLRVGSTFGPQ